MWKHNLSKRLTIVHCFRSETEKSDLELQKVDGAVQEEQNGISFNFVVSSSGEFECGSKYQSKLLSIVQSFQTDFVKK